LYFPDFGPVCYPGETAPVKPADDSCDDTSGVLHSCDEDDSKKCGSDYNDGWTVCSGLRFLHTIDTHFCYLYSTHAMTSLLKFRHAGLLLNRPLVPTNDPATLKARREDMLCFTLTFWSCPFMSLFAHSFIYYSPVWALLLHNVSRQTILEIVQ